MFFVGFGWFAELDSMSWVPWVRGAMVGKINFEQLQNVASKENWVLILYT